MCTAHTPAGLQAGLRCKQLAAPHHAQPSLHVNTPQITSIYSINDGVALCVVDEKSLNVNYDAKRGEPRGKPKKNVEQTLGDCVNCGHCVKVCPTGIDIRDGVQLECIGCTKCIDACDTIMDAWKRPRGLVRYASLDQLEGKEHSLLRPRVWVYAGLITILLSVFGVLVVNRDLTTVALVRKGAAPYMEMGTDSIANIFSLDIRNKSGDKSGGISPVSSTGTRNKVLREKDAWVFRAGVL